MFFKETLENQIRDEIKKIKTPIILYLEKVLVYIYILSFIKRWYVFGHI